MKGILSERLNAIKAYRGYISAALVHGNVSFAVGPRTTNLKNAKGEASPKNHKTWGFQVACMPQSSTSRLFALSRVETFHLLLEESTQLVQLEDNAGSSTPSRH